ncbi:MAG TPA: type II toxin-antitoxin system VapC family toxin [Acetobacteraceae bacterium]|nr:type II toxin-antitoxin system VapC family toxin [Acetobacteraceae bacterium]
MPRLVLDCSVAVAWCFEDEAAPELDALLDRIQTEGAVVPPLWTLELANVLLMAARRGRIAREAVQERFALLDMLAIETDSQGSGTVWRSTVLALAQTETLTFHDAIYLELAIRRGLPLASSDKALRRAAVQRGVAVAPATAPPIIPAKAQGRTGPDA